MVVPRRAARNGASPAAASGIFAAIGLLSGALISVATAMAFLSVSMARRVVKPAARAVDTEILGLDTAAQTITLVRTPDTELPGRYGLFTTGTTDYVKLGSVLAEDSKTVTRKLLTHIGGRDHLSSRAAFSGWYYDRPEDLQLPFTIEKIGSPLGPCPAWLFAAAEPTDVWVIQVHGRGTTRSECLRAVPLLHRLGLTTLVVSYRNDGEGPRTSTGTYSLGATEWRDVDAAVGFARRRGARRVILMGWSMGGAISLQLVLASVHADTIVGIILDSPVIDWRNVLDFQASLLHVPRPVARLAIGTLASPWSASVTGAGAAIPFAELDVLSRAGELRHPILILHSDDDGFVPSDASHALQAARPDLVELQVFDVARHTKLWNYDQMLWSDAIESWVLRHGFMSAASTGDS